MFLALSSLFSLVSFVSFVIVVVQLFKKKGVGHGIAGILCGLYTFIWGWQSAGSLDAEGQKVGMTYRGWMMLWTVALAASVVAGGPARVHDEPRRSGPSFVKRALAQRPSSSPRRCSTSPFAARSHMSRTSSKPLGPP